MSDSAGPQTSAAWASLDRAGSAAEFFDERFSAPEEIRPHWQGLLSSLERLGLEELAARAENSRRILAEHGVSCFVSRDGVSLDEPWQLDTLPLVIGSEEWAELEAGLLQRARLLNLILGDLYGKQRLIRDGFVPAPLVFANPGYLRACQAIEVKGNTYLQLCAADLGRSPDGRWWVLADRTQAPAGLGFAMENRSLLSRVLPEAMSELQPRPVLDTLRIRREALRRFAPDHADNPSIALLTPGPRNEAYFEHAYLSRLLGLTLVEGDDLTVRDRKLFVKTLDGLRRADVVLRKVNDALCDPLELRGDSLLGVPGLVEAARAGHLTIGNALGTGLLESPAFMPFLPGLCRHLLDEELRLPSLATWWCGQAREQALVRDRLEDLVVRPALTLGNPGVIPSRLSAFERDKLLDRIRLQPHEFVGQEQIQISRAPVWTKSRVFDSKSFVLRAFVLHDGNDFTVMPGGLARVVEQERLYAGSLSLSGLSKDVWVLPDKAAIKPEPLGLSAPLPALERVPSDLPSRTADNFFWLGRYTERLEQIVRAARHVLGRLTEDSSPQNQRRLVPVAKVLARLRLITNSSATGGSVGALQKEILSLLFGQEPAGGVRDLLKRIQVTAFSVRDRLSADTWRILNRLEPDARQRPGRLPLMQASSVLYTLVLDLAAFSGMEMENMTRGHAWSFLDFGRRIERAIFIARLTEALLRSGADLDFLLDPVLEIADSVMTHRRRYFSEPRLGSALEVIVLDSANPRSLAFQIASLRRHAAALPTGAQPEGVAAVQRRVNELQAQLGCLDESDEKCDLSNLPKTADVLAGFSAGLAELSELLTQVYFSHVTPRVS